MQKYLFPRCFGLVWAVFYDFYFINLLERLPKQLIMLMYCLSAAVLQSLLIYSFQDRVAFSYCKTGYILICWVSSFGSHWTIFTKYNIPVQIASLLFPTYSSPSCIMQYFIQDGRGWGQYVLKRILKLGHQMSQKTL